MNWLPTFYARSIPSVLYKNIDGSPYGPFPYLFFSKHFQFFTEVYNFMAINQVGILPPLKGYIAKCLPPSSLSSSFLYHNRQFSLPSNAATPAVQKYRLSKDITPLPSSSFLPPLLPWLSPFHTWQLHSQTSRKKKELFIWEGRRHKSLWRTNALFSPSPDLSMWGSSWMADFFRLGEGPHFYFFTKMFPLLPKYAKDMR